MKKSEEEVEKAGDIALKGQLDLIKVVMAGDLEMISNSKLDDLKILNLDEKLYKRIIELIKISDQPEGKPKSAPKEEPIKKDTEQRRIKNISDLAKK